jgi:hypothetical protein
MLRIFHGTNYDFVRPWRIAVGITVAFIVAGFVFLGVHKARTGTFLNQSIEFTGGTLMQLEFKQPPDVGQIRATRTPRSSSSAARASSPFAPRGTAPRPPSRAPPRRSRQHSSGSSAPRTCASSAPRSLARASGTS